LKSIYVGCDPGKSGSITILDDSNKIVFCELLPTIITKDKKDKKITEFDVRKLYNIFLSINIRYSDYKIHVCVEKVHSLFGSGSTATFKFGYSYGVLRSLANIFFDCEDVSPKDWQKKVWDIEPILKFKNGKDRTDTKKTSENVALRIWPGYDFRKSKSCKINHDGKIDSSLIAYYSYLKNKDLIA